MDHQTLQEMYVKAVKSEALKWFERSDLKLEEKARGLMNTVFDLHGFSNFELVLTETEKEELSEHIQGYITFWISFEDLVIALYDEVNTEEKYRFEGLVFGLFNIFDQGYADLKHEEYPNLLAGGLHDLYVCNNLFKSVSI